MSPPPNELPLVSAGDSAVKEEWDREKAKHEIRARDRELELRERETTAREREVAAKEQELKRSKWSNPLVIGLVAAALGLFGNLAVAILNNRATQDLERRRAQSNLVVELIRTGDTEKAVKNLKFFLDHGLLDDPDNMIRKSLSDQNAAPVLPAANASSRTGFGYLTVTSEPMGAVVTIDGRTVGLTNLSVVVSAGQHSVSVVLGKNRSDRNVLVTEGASIDLHFKL